MLKPSLNTKTLSAIAMLLGIVIILGALIFEARITAQPSIINGLQQSEYVTYQLFTDPSAPAQSGTLKPSASGTAQLPPIAWKNNKDPQTLLNLQIENPQNQAHKTVTIRYNADKETYAIEAAGLKSFENIEYGLGSLSQKTKADWTGLFHETQLETQNKDEPLKIAFTGSMADLSPQTNPLMIEIQSSSAIKNIVDEPPSDSFARVIRLLNEIPQDRRNQVENNINAEKHKKPLQDNLIRPLMLLTQQISATLFQHSLMIGSFFDAKHQLETQRDLQVLQAEAHRDYHPSEQMCMFGTFSRSLNNAQSRAKSNKQALDKILFDRLNNKTGSAAGHGSEIPQRITKFISRYCNPADQNEALKVVCKTPGDKLYNNLDIDISRLVLEPLTLDIDFLGSNGDDNLQKDVVELGKNLYLFKTLDAVTLENGEDEYPAWLNTRRLMAMQNIAQNSYTALVGAKAEAFEAGSTEKSGPFMKKLIELLLDPGSTPPTGDRPTPSDILGENPSYYAMMEILTKKIYQDPRFYTNLYDKPANVERVKASLQAIQLMQNRDRYESLLRQEMLSSMLLEEAIIREQSLRTEGGLSKSMSKAK